MLAGATAGAMAAMSGSLGRVVDEAYAAEPTKHAPLSDIEHVIFVMMENRSFDHYFGTYPGVRGFGDPHAIPGVFKQRGYRAGMAPTSDGHLYPFHLDTKDLAQLRRVRRRHHPQLGAAARGVEPREDGSLADGASRGRRAGASVR